MIAKEKLKIFKDEKDKYHFKAKDNSHIDIDYKDRRLKFKLHKWNKEASVEAFLDMVEADTHTFSGNKIELEDSKKKIRVYPIDTRSTADFYGDTTDNVQCHDGGLRYDIMYFEKPPTNFFDTRLVCKNTRWSKQPFLTQEDIEQGTSCPINVESSYAIYHVSKKNNEYMTGKFGQRYRPIAIDAEGNMAWCDDEVDRLIDPTNIRTTIPQQFLDEAVYPVVIDPDFGYTTIGGTWSIIASYSKGTPVSFRAGSAWTCPATSTANNIKAYLRSNITDIVDCKAFINEKDSGGAGTHGQIATKENLACAAAAHWEEFTLAGEALTAAVVYILNIVGDGNDVSDTYFYQVAFDVNGAVASYRQVHNYAAPVSPWIIAPEGITKDYSIYVNYPFVPEPAVEEGGLRMTLSLKGHMGYDLKTRGGKARRRVG